MQRLAAWCYQYSSQVCIPGDRAGLFLETGASQRLIGPSDYIWLNACRGGTGAQLGYLP